MRIWHWLTGKHHFVPLGFTDYSTPGRVYTECECNARRVYYLPVG